MFLVGVKTFDWKISNFRVDSFCIWCVKALKSQHEAPFYVSMHLSLLSAIFNDYSHQSWRGGCSNGNHCLYLRWKSVFSFTLLNCLVNIYGQPCEFAVVIILYVNSNESDDLTPF